MYHYIDCISLFEGMRKWVKWTLIRSIMTSHGGTNSPHRDLPRNLMPLAICRRTSLKSNPPGPKLQSKVKSKFEEPELTGIMTKSNDRRSLLKILTIYTDAIQLRDTSKIPVSPNVRITNNGDLSTLGKGLVWQIPGEIRIPYRRVLVDPKTGAATLRATVSNEVISMNANPAEITKLPESPADSQWAWYTLRLKIVDGLITEIEEIVGKVGLPGSPASKLISPDRIWDTIVPESQRSTDEELYKIADDYFSAVSGTLSVDDAPFHPECNRFELGAQTTNAIFLPGGCGVGLLSPTLKGLEVTNRRFYVTDVELGVVCAMGKFTPHPDMPKGAVSAVFLTLVWLMVGYF
jgi:hypothetical protein